MVRNAFHYDWLTYGVHNGYAGLMADDLTLLGPRDVGRIVQAGGTMLGSARSLEFKTEEGRKKALDNLAARGINALVVIGGNGTQTGSYMLSQMGFSVVGVASTIDNDLVGSDITIGVDTALNIALEAIDRLKVTASSHKRAFLVEVMGRDCGYLALVAGIAGGAEVVVIPEKEITPEEVARELWGAYQRGKTHALVVVAEGARYNAAGMAAYFEEHHESLGFNLRYTILGHVQRGGLPTAADRLLGTRLGAGAVECLARDETGVLVGSKGGTITATPLAEVVTGKKPLPRELLDLTHVLSR